MWKFAFFFVFFVGCDNSQGENSMSEETIPIGYVQPNAEIHAQLQKVLKEGDVNFFSLEGSRTWSLLVKTEDRGKAIKALRSSPLQKRIRFYQSK
jgi:hypothetical protein